MYVDYIHVSAPVNAGLHGTLAEAMQLAFEEWRVVELAYRYEDGGGTIEEVFTICPTTIRNEIIDKQSARSGSAGKDTG